MNSVNNNSLLDELATYLALYVAQHFTNSNRYTNIDTNIG